MANCGKCELKIPHPEAECFHALATKDLIERLSKPSFYDPKFYPEDEDNDGEFSDEG